MDTKNIFVGFILIIFGKNVQCQMGGMMQMMTAIPNMVNGMRESQARSQLTPIVRYVVGDTATPSPEMVNFAVIAGSAPVTQTEKDAYLDMMKKVARRTPEVLVKFLKVKNGTHSVDEAKLDAHITKRAMQYAAASGAKKERKRKEEERKRQQELELIRMQQKHELDLIGILGPNLNNGEAHLLGTSANAGLFGLDPSVPYDSFGTGFDQLAHSGILQPATEPANQAPAVNSAASPPTKNVDMSGGFTLLDLFRRHEQNIQESRPSSAATQVTTAAQVSASQINPAVNPNTLNMLMFNGGMDMAF